MNKKTICTLLALAILLASTTACGGTASTDTTADTTPEVTTEPPRDDLPDMTFGGETFNILCRTEWAYEFDVEETGDVVDDAIWARNRAVEERFDVKLAFTHVNGLWDDREGFLGAISTSVMANDGAYDMVAGYQAYMVTPALEGLLLNILTMEHIDPEAKWWSQKCVESTTVNGKLFLLPGDIALSLWESIFVMYYNKQLAKEYEIDDLYALVNDGKWTHDKLYELSTKVSADVNGDSQFDENDLYGFASSNDNHARVWFAPYDLPITTRNADGFMEMSYNTARTHNALEKLVQLYSAQSSYKKFMEFDELHSGWKGSNMFSENRVLFAPAFLQTATKLRAMETDFGIIPLPKFDENQEDYITTVHDSTSVVCFPKTVKNAEMSGLIAEALCIYSHYDVIPEYYELTLKTKGARDEESGEMIDLIRDSVMFDFGALHTVPMNGTIDLLGNLIVQGNTNFASKYASKEKSFEANLAAINEAYKNAE